MWKILNAALHMLADVPYSQPGGALTKAAAEKSVGVQLV